MNTSTKLILFSQPTKKGFPLKIRIIQERKAVFIGLKFYLSESQKQKYWNDTKDELRKSYPFYSEVMAEYNKELNNLGIETIDNKAFIEQEPIINNDSFSSFYNNYMKVLKLKNQFGLLQKVHSVQLQLNTYCNETGKSTDILFKDLNIDFMNGFQNHLVKQKILPITQRGYIEKIRSIINLSIRQDKYNPKRHPFMGFDFIKIDTSPKCLNKQQFELLKSIIINKDYVKILDIKTNKKIPPYSRELEKIGLKFLFQYYSYGMRVSDLLLLRWSNIYESGKRLNFKMFKTKNNMDVVLNNELLDILFEFMDYETRISIMKNSNEEGGEIKRKVGNVVLRYNKKTEYYELIRNKLYLLSLDPEKKNNRIFSKIEPELTPENDMKKIYSKISTYTSVYNKELKELSKQLNIHSAMNFNLSSHMARHTFAYLSLLSGQSIYYISQALNHKSIKTTETYLRGFNSRSLDNKFYKEELSATEKEAINNKLRELLGSNDYDKKKKVLDLFNL